MNNGVVPNGNIVTDIYMRINLNIIPNLYLISDVRESTAIDILSNSTVGTDKAWFFDAVFLKADGLVIFFQKGSKTNVGIIYQNQGCFNWLACYKIFFNDNGGSFGSPPSSRSFRAIPAATTSTSRPNAAS